LSIEHVYRWPVTEDTWIRCGQCAKCNQVNLTDRTEYTDGETGVKMVRYVGVPLHHYSNS